jgi:hypothetical protein
VAIVEKKMNYGVVIIRLIVVMANSARDVVQMIGKVIGNERRK